MLDSTGIIRRKNKPGVNVIKITFSTEADYAAACHARGHENWISVKGVLIEDSNEHRLRNQQNLKEVNISRSLYKDEID